MYFYLNISSKRTSYVFFSWSLPGLITSLNVEWSLRIGSKIVVQPIALSWIALSLAVLEINFKIKLNILCLKMIKQML